MIEFTCPNCGSQMASPDSMAGQKESCPQCGNVTVVPQPTVPTAVRQSGPPAPPPQSYAQPNQTPQVDVNVKGVKSTNGLGVAALVLGLIAALTCWIPFVGMLGIPLAVLGIIFGTIGFLAALIGRKSGIGMPVSGMIVCGVALVVAIGTTGGTVAAMNEAAEEQHPKKNSRAGTNDAAPGKKKERAYLDTIELRNVEVADTVLGGKGVFGEVKNVGNRTLSTVKIMVYCLDRNGTPVFEEDYYPVLVTDSDFSMSDDKPLKPNYSEKFGYSLDDAPSEWNGDIRVEVVEVEFAD